MDSLTFATWTLVVITFLYVIATGALVLEARSQRADEAARERRRRGLEIESLRHALAGELRQILAMIEGREGEARNFMTLPAVAWQSALSHPATLTDAARDRLFAVYSEVERLNALARFLLSPHAVKQQGAIANPDASSMGLSRHTSADFLTRAIREALTIIAGLPDPE